MTKEERVELEPLDFANQYMRNNYGKLLEADPDEYHLRLGMLGDALTDFHALNTRISPDTQRIREEAIRECAEICGKERLADDLNNEGDIGYNHAIDDCERAIRSLLTTKPDNVGRVDQWKLDAENYEDFKQKLNKILHPNGGGPERPSGCDLLAYVEADLKQLAQLREVNGKLVEALLCTHHSLLNGITWEHYKGTLAEKESVEALAHAKGLEKGDK